MTDEYERQEFWVKKEIKHIKFPSQDSLLEIIKTKAQADDFMNQLNFIIEQAKKSKTNE